MSNTSDPGHGSSLAAWVAVIVMLVAITIGTFAFWFDLPWLVLASTALLIGGLLVGWLLAKAGYGVGGSKHRPKAHD